MQRLALETATQGFAFCEQRRMPGQVADRNGTQRGRERLARGLYAPEEVIGHSVSAHPLHFHALGHGKLEIGG